MKLLLFLLTHLLYSYCSQNLRIGEGAEVDDPTKFPFFAQLRIPQYDTLYIFDECGGALINPQWIITSGHCFPWEAEKIQWVINQKKEVIFMGSIYTNQYNNDSEGSSRRIKNIFHHPNYVYEQRLVENKIVEMISNDIAIAELNEPFALSPVIQPIRLSTSFGDEDSGILIGIGMTNINDLDTNTKTVHYAVLPIKDVKDLTFHLNHETNTTFYLEGIISDEEEDSTGYALYGDSGGPFINNVTDAVAPTLLGVLSVIQYNILQGRVVHAVERVDLAMDFILPHIRKVEDTLLGKSRKALNIQAVKSGSRRKTIANLFIILLCMFIYQYNLLFYYFLCVLVLFTQENEQTRM